MRGFLLFLSLAFPVALMSPVFWSLVAMEFSAAPVAYVNHDGTAQQALLGPKAPWPDWALVPDNAELRVKAWFGPTPSQPETGYGDLGVGNAPRTSAAHYADKLRSAGWQVETYRFRSVLPSLPPQPLDRCIIRASRQSGDDRKILASLDLQPYPGTGSIHWSRGALPPLLGTTKEEC